jgi:hypothetical protein
MGHGPSSRRCPKHGSLPLFSGRRARRVEPGGADVNGFAMGAGMGCASTAGTPATM